MEDNICAPKKYDPENNTCFSLDQLVELVKAYNRHITKKKLKPYVDENKLEIKYQTVEPIEIRNDKKYLLTQLKKRFDHICGDNESCLTKQEFMNEIAVEMRDDIKNAFRPQGPKKSNEWLSTFDINNIMVQYEDIYPEFRFLGAVPLDCDELSFCTLYDLDFDVCLTDGIRYLGIIFNLDRYGQPGSHWVTLFIDLHEGEICFCDSNGNPPVHNIKKIIEKFMDFYLRKTGNKATYKCNKNAYQQDDTECGVYSCNFIIRKLAGESFESIVNNPLSFREINSCRNAYFRNKPSKYPTHAKCNPIRP